MIANVFVAASWADREVAKQISEELEKDGLFNVTTRWWNHTGQNNACYAREDIDSVKAADIFVMYNTEKRTTGKIAELGMALLRGIPIFIFGEKIDSIYGSIVFQHAETTPSGIYEKLVKIFRGETGEHI